MMIFYKESDFQEVKYYGKVYCLSVSSNGNSNVNGLNVFLLRACYPELLILSFEL